MAQKRMFDKTITNSDEFLELPDSSQVLYFHLSMNADDDGFVNNWKSIIKMTGTKEDDLKMLIYKKFIIPFESGIIVITHWRINNYLRNDRYKETNYKNELSLLDVEENGEYTLKNDIGIPLVYPEKNRIEKNRIEYNILPQNDETLFDIFWENYPKKLDKKNAKKSFDKIKPNEELVNEMVKQIERFKDTKEWKDGNGKYIPYPSTWLNGRRWEDEFETDIEREERIDKEIMEGTYGIKGC